MSRNQNPNKPISKVVHDLRQLAKDCNIRDLNAGTYQNELSRDALKIFLVLLQFDKSYLKMILT